MKSYIKHTLKQNIYILQVTLPHFTLYIYFHIYLRSSCIAENLIILTNMTHNFLVCVYCNPVLVTSDQAW